MESQDKRFNVEALEAQRLGQNYLTAMIHHGEAVAKEQQARQTMDNAYRAWILGPKPILIGQTKLMI